MTIPDHPLRFSLANELHARPFPVMACPGQVAYLAIHRPEGAAERDRAADRAHLIALLDRHGAQHPTPDATHYFGQIGKYRLKWEQHTEFVTYTAFLDALGERPFDPALWEVFPADWLAEAPGARLTSAQFRIVERSDDVAAMAAHLAEWFVPESLAVSRVLDDTALIAGDFRIASSGHMQFALFTQPGLGRRRIGRIVQRLCEIETYKAMSMLGLVRAREVARSLGEAERELSVLTAEMAGDVTRADETLGRLLSAAAGLENLAAQSNFRFAATGAYEAIVNQRIAVLREERFEGRQTFSEFMMRRFDPAMRTVKATEQRLHSLIARAARAGDLLRTRVDVDRQAQNQIILESMDRRADLQLRLQRTVEGLSVVAISYYAVNLVVYLLRPMAEQIGLSYPVLTALAVLPVVILVWIALRAIRRAMD